MATNIDNGTNPSRFVVQHCSQCDVSLGWHDLPLIGVSLCNVCIHECLRVVCFQCDLTHQHNITKVDNETLDIYNILPEDSENNKEGSIGELSESEQRLIKRVRELRLCNEDKINS